MGISRKISLILSILAVCLPMHAHASDLANDPFIRQVLDRQHFEPDGKYHLFGSRGELAERSGHIGLGNIQSHQLGNLMIQQAAIKGNIGYIVRFSDHGHEVHSPFDNHASHSDSDEAGSPVDGFSLYRIHWDGYEHHPADGYDGPQGGGYPAPKGARDIYSYDIKGVAQNIRLNLTDNRSTGQRLADRFHNAGAMLTQGVGDGFKRATRYSPELDRSGNAAEAFNGTADIVKNIIGAAGEIVGAGDAVQGISEGSNIAVMHGLGLLSTENKMARINDLADMAQLKDYAAAAIRDWAVQNPNAAQGIEAVSNIFTAVIPVKGIGAVRGKYGLGGITAHPVKRSQMGAIALPKGKSAVSDNFADAAYAKYPSPYHSRNIRSNLEQRYGKENITSSTVPPSNGKNVKLADQRHPKTGVPFDGKGFPNFEKHVKYDTKLDIQELSGGGIPKAKPVFDAKPRWEVDRKLNKLTTREQVEKNVQETRRRSQSSQFKAHAQREWENKTGLDFNHFIGGDINKKGTVTGGHSLTRGDVRVIQQTSAPDKHGVYQATVEIKKPDGSWEVKTKKGGKVMTKHTMFPKDWDEARIRAEVTSAWESRIMLKDNKWQGTSKSGIKIEGFTEPNRTAYPIYE
ncbi:TPA: polymorphic toxin MafB class 2 [Neisseria gonorrhoeae]|uniref:polymorphic toxin MafB class 2 n=2 Tax=Neisseria gonorrhoeae TaxID=485 RepID=UPI00031A2E52|nr:polymorphic toxin MafB class 2 [Neisseria gonorrhoeae]KLR96540.1 septum formation inhibitor Maf [Neisseria gonorrhoeae SK14515]AZG31443.1 polymorphic toxin MafB class 2 [Neisseria gonorrhoeae]EEZ47195.2 MafB family adhesin protein [Neisseria gonorrhoeae MS11]KLR91666.1 septum formation inhibitor Maf [Neisseria gonorrhoeae SK28355]KLS01750.1 septum formation inhibitor Maf [Neisseria gonorrhoeae SK16942]